ncbi:MAG: Rpn family recombination-promoting nuclease/putative transposase, partial [Clostridiales bacterium]|nr:Rpn family recombination-promoting nuclease/putative transposase [Clostridiales bacterium]
YRNSQGYNRKKPASRNITRSRNKYPRKTRRKLHKLKETFTDIIYKVKIKNKETYIALLLEHKSYKDRLTIFQVSRYIIDLWSKIIESGKKELPAVIPIVIYHGKSKWDYKTDIRELIADYNELPKYLKDRLPVLKHDLINLAEHTEEDIKQYKPLTKMVIRSFKYIFGTMDELIETFLISIEEAADKVADEDLYTIVEIMLIYYSAAAKDLTEEDILKKIKKLGGKGGKLMTILEQREQRGMEKGIEKGILLGISEERKNLARKMLMDKEPENKIMKYTNLDEEAISKIKKELQN